VSGDPHALPMDWRDVPDPGMFDWQTAVQARIRSWVPASVRAPVWEQIAEPVRTTVSRAHPVSAAMATDLLGALTAVAVFAAGRGVPARPEQWLAEPTLTAFAEHGRPDLLAATRRCYVSRVRALTDPLPLSDRDVFTPYAPSEMTALWAAAGAQSTPGRCRDARVLIALGAGAGLSASEIAQVRAHDVRPAGAAVVVSVRGPAQRLVVVRRAFEHTLADAAHQHTGRIVYLLAPGRFARPGVVSSVAGGLAAPEKCPRISTRRLRASWLVELAGTRVPLPVLAAAAGITDLRALTRLLRFLHQPDVDDAADLLRDL
jgi:hypothetical protein